MHCSHPFPYGFVNNCYVIAITFSLVAIIMYATLGTLYYVILRSRTSYSPIANRRILFATRSIS